MGVCWRVVVSVRVAVTLAALIICLSFVIISVTEQLTPHLQLGIAGATLVLLLIAVFDDLNRRRFYGYLLSLLAIGVLFQVTFLIRLPGLIGMDPHLYAVLIHTVREAGSIGPITISFYESAANYIVAMAIVGSVLSVPAEQTALIVPIIVGGGLSLLGALIARAVAPHYLAVLTAAGTLVNSPVLARFGFWPLAQSYAIVLFAVCVLLLIIWLRSQDLGRKRYFFAFLAAAVSLTFTHKFPIFILVALLLVLTVAARATHSPSQHAIGWSLVVIGVVLLWLWTFPTNFVSKVVLFGATVASGFDFGVSTPEFAAASPVQTGIWEQVSRQLNWIILIITGGIGWLLLSYRAWQMRPSALQPPVIIVLAVAPVLMGIFATSIVAPAGELNPLRVLTLSIPILAALVAVIIHMLQLPTSSYERGTVIAVIVILIAAQLAATGAAGFYPDQEPRDYLTTSEQDAKAFITTYTEDETIHTDPYNVRAGDPPHDPPPGHWQYSQGTFQSHGVALFDGSFEPVAPDLIAYRTIVEVYGHLPWSGNWVLEWKPEETLDACGNIVYTNGDVDIYETDQCWDTNG